MALQPKELTPVARYSMELAVMEVGLGSALHAMHVPFRGQFLSMNQGFLLSRASFVAASGRRDATRLSSQISLITACLKSLSPLGRRLTPMLAITVQGLLFSLGQALGGVSILGHTLGITLVSTWAVLQPILIGTLVGGMAFLQGLETLMKIMTPTSYPNLGWVFLGSVLGLIWALGFAAVLLSKKMTDDQWAKLQQRLKREPPSPGKSKLLKLPFHPLWLFSLVISYGFLVFGEKVPTTTIWEWMRPIGGFLAALLVLELFKRTHATERIIQKTESRFPEFSRNLATVNHWVFGK
ncbi:MAG: hypothetical protein JNL01_12405 [Bdellovibrionales bacterium]|nr:hypothetical protein [Bdellovibrionales bacterium]